MTAAPTVQRKTIAATAIGLMAVWTIALRSGLLRLGSGDE
jgi:hypothetical protein